MIIKLNAKERKAVEEMAKQMDIAPERVPIMALRFYQVHMAMVKRGAVHVKWFDGCNNRVELDNLRKKKQPPVSDNEIGGPNDYAHGM